MYNVLLFVAYLWFESTFFSHEYFRYFSTEIFTFRQVLLFCTCVQHCCNRDKESCTVYVQVLSTSIVHYACASVVCSFGLHGFPRRQVRQTYPCGSWHVNGYTCVPGWSFCVSDVIPLFSGTMTLFNTNKSRFSEWTVRCFVPEVQWTCSLPVTSIVIEVGVVSLVSSKETCPVIRSPLEKVLASFRASRLMVQFLIVFSNISIRAEA